MLREWRIRCAERLHRARMFRDRADLTKAKKLIRDLGYGRRYGELADAEGVLSTV